MTSLSQHPIAIIISAGSEWRAVRELLADAEVERSALGEWFSHLIETESGNHDAIFFHGGWGKIAAAASAQYVIDRWSPRLLVNLGTCGGIAGDVERGEIILAERTVVYDIIEQMGDPDEAIAHYSVGLDLSWLGEEIPTGTRRTLLVSADRDLVASETALLRTRYGAVAGDWESGAIAWVAQRNDVRTLILRGVSDLVGSEGGEAYGRIEIFHENTREIMARLLDALPAWLARAD